MRKFAKIISSFRVTGHFPLTRYSAHGPVMLSRLCSAEAVPLPTPEGEPKVYPEKIHSLVSEISKLTIAEVADLNELLKKTLNISEAPVMAAFGALPLKSPQEEEEEEEQQVQTKQTSFTVKMTGFEEAKKVAVIKQIKMTVEGMNLVQAKKFVESLPGIVKADLPKDEADKLVETFKALGAECIAE